MNVHDLLVPEEGRNRSARPHPSFESNAMQHTNLNSSMNNEEERQETDESPAKPFDIKDYALTAAERRLMRSKCVCHFGV